MNKQGGKFREQAARLCVVGRFAGFGQPVSARFPPVALGPFLLLVSAKKRRLGWVGAVTSGYVANLPLAQKNSVDGWTCSFGGRRSASWVAVTGRCVSLQITTLKVLAGHPDGRASHADVTRIVAILTSSGADWSDRMKRLAARAPDLNIFSSGYVIRDESGWQITDALRAFLASIEAPAFTPALPIEPEVQLAVNAEPELPPNVVRFAKVPKRRRKREAA